MKMTSQAFNHLTPYYKQESKSTSWQIDGETVETVSDFIFFLAPKSLQMVTAAMKLKDALSLEGKLYPT